MVPISSNYTQLVHRTHLHVYKHTHTHRHYDKHPLRAVPIPAYNLADTLHAQLALLGNRAETVAAQVPLSGSTASSRTAIRGALREDGVMQEIDRYARELLPGHADPA